jgi:hypothetical protein
MYIDEKKQYKCPSCHRKWYQIDGQHRDVLYLETNITANEAIRGVCSECWKQEILSL